jgi:hypothetical protein
LGCSFDFRSKIAFNSSSGDTIRVTSLPLPTVTTASAREPPQLPEKEPEQAVEEEGRRKQE